MTQRKPLAAAVHHLLRTTALGLAGLLMLTGCDRVARAPEYADSLAVMRESSHVQLISRDITQAVASTQYPQALAEFQKKGQAVDQDPEQVRLAHSITKRLVDQAVQVYPSSRPWDWELHVITTDELNASCMAGGKMVMYSGLMEQVGKNPHKIAAVMGHEISHALLEHTRQSLTRELAVHSGLWTVAKSLKIGAARAEQIQSDLSLVTRPIERQYEREADALGLELMARAGFDPIEGSKVWLDMKKDFATPGARRLVAFVSDHPLDDERLATLSALAPKLKAQLQSGARSGPGVKP